MTNYYFLATMLPPLQIGVPPEIRFQEFQNLLKDNLSEADYAKAKAIRLLYDLENIRAFWRGRDLDPWGNLDEMELEEALLGVNGLPDYVDEFLSRHPTLESRLHHFPFLTATYFSREGQASSGFLKEYFAFEREWRLVLTALRAKQLGRDITTELQYEDPDDDFLAQILAQKDAKTYTPPDEYHELKPIFEAHSNDPLSLHQALCEYRFRKIEELLGVDAFSIERILGYMAQLILVEKWEALDKEKGLLVTDHVLTKRK